MQGGCFLHYTFPQLRNRANTASISNMIELSSKQRKILETYAQPLQSVVIVGQNGVTEAVEKMTDAALAAHELIKISFNEFKEEKRDLAASLSEACSAVLVRVIDFVPPRGKSGRKKIRKSARKNKSEKKHLKHRQPIRRCHFQSSSFC